MRTWVLLHAVAWRSMLPGVGLSLGGLTAAHAWTWAGEVLLPFVLAATAAASGQTFDDDARRVTALSPRGGAWAAGTRLLAATVPLGWWLLTVLLWTGAEDTSGWWLVGLACCSVAAGSAGVASRREVARPGGVVAAVLVTVVLVPLVLGPFLEWTALFPGGPFPDRVLLTWTALAALGVALCLAAVRPAGPLLRARTPR